MEFNVSFAIGEIVQRSYDLLERGAPKTRHLEVTAVAVGSDGEEVYVCEDIETGRVGHYSLSQLDQSKGNSPVLLKSAFGIGEIVIREVHTNGKSVSARMMEVISIIFNHCGEVTYACEDAYNGHRQIYSESMLVGDPDFDQKAGKYPKEVLPEETNAVSPTDEEK